MNSRMACSYERFELADVRLFKTADFDCSRSGSLRIVFGVRFRLPFAMRSGLQCRGEKHDPPSTLVPSSAFMGINFRLFCNNGRLGAHRQGEMCINWVTFLKSKRKFRLRSVMLCELPTIAGLEQT
jgi:hypothetical protein